MEWDILVGALCAVGGLIISYAVFSRAKARDDAQEGESKGTLFTELGYIKANTDEIKAEQKEQRNTNIVFVDRLAAVESSTKQAHHRLDRLEGKESK